MSKQLNITRQSPAKKISNIVDKPKKDDISNDQKGKALENVKGDKAQDKDKGEKAAPLKKSSQFLLAKTKGSKTIDAIHPTNKAEERRKVKDDNAEGFDPQATAAILALPEADSLRHRKDKEVHEKERKVKEKKETMKVEIIDSDGDDLPLKEAFGDTPSEKDPRTKK
ncbi:hypothetical protein M514_02768 [Trichuris suis]|uniref:Uncharacterized protein n=1 Tax=Trichuris suis TaxID=68888 RepID=A0A085MGG7_9BILA|nr:hypothetical protein M513_02768 [Trichuris suis]KFD68756.1 hypothetical protein M514_02768 [Trichuris suis]